MIRYSLCIAAAAAILASAASVAPADVLGAAFNYQGQLKQEGEPLNQPADFLFTLHDEATAGNPIGAQISLQDVAVSEGLFTVDLDFGASAFGNDERWLEIAVRLHDPKDLAAYTTLSPRQSITPTPLALRVMTPRVVRPEDYGAVMDDGLDDLAAFNDAVASMGGTGYFVLELGSGVYTLSSEFAPTAQLLMRGPTAYGANEPSAHIQFNPGTNGLHLTKPTTLEHVRIESLGGKDAEDPVIGILAEATVRFSNVWVEDFSSHGIHLDGSFGALNGWYVTTGRLRRNGGNGLHVNGADANSGMALAVDARDNLGWGFYDSSFLGNTYVACWTHSNDLGAYRSDTIDGRNLYLGCYAEQDQTSTIPFPAKWIGGLATVNGTGIILSEENSLGQFQNAIEFLNDLEPTSRVVFRAGSSNDPETFFELRSEQEEDAGGLPWRMSYVSDTEEEEYGWFKLEYGNTNFNALLLSGEQADLRHGFLWIPGHFLGKKTTISNRIQVGVGRDGGQPPLQSDDAPWPVGSVIWNKLVEPGSWSGWRVTDIDESGNITWKGFGRVGELRGAKLFPTSGTVEVAFSEDDVQPDSSYFVTLGGNANENFWVTNKTVNGFTINSSNASSTATVDWFLTR